MSVDDAARTTLPLWRESSVPVPTALWPADDRFDDIVVGGGITGLTTALLLARAGRRVGVLEARQVGAVTTGATTGKLSLLQGTKLSRLLEVHSTAVAQAYVDANREGQQWLMTFCETHAVPLQEREAATYAATHDELTAVQAEHDAADRLGLPVSWRDRLDVPFPVCGATVLPDQAQFDPMDVLRALAVQLQEHGGTIHEECRVVGVSKIGEPTVRTAEGRELQCDNVVLATGTPILDRGLYFAKVEAMRSYLLAFASAPAVPASMLISAGSSRRSVRDVPQGDGDPLLLVGGNGHPVGRVRSEVDHLDELREWASTYFPGAVETHAWSAQDYVSHDGVPYVGKLPRGLGRAYVATGFDKWGMTNAVAAARSISGQILGSSPSWAKPLRRRITGPKPAQKLVLANLKVGKAALESVVRAELTEADLNPAEGHGNVGRAGLNPVPVGSSNEAGTTCQVAAICTHLGGTLHWNDAEHTWDCPLHGSRFTPQGAVLEGPATRPLARKNV